ncbi:thiolase family protein [Nocardia asteroides NBRC 15531]|uniref:Thiolase n=1 Tax=Nocardia asteroides NBRC 15531 TaxID=1110697 RepID=U5E727_NOCAS|nr:thiolase family protein [Nocardia asteroides]TLF66790.1 thiolase family protein [Nocardia asteroides NBRC 15531]UGT46098.1 thiolase family protein [Nocardia asteroides]SFN01044.1 Acetyl-CoA acetyltransferase [Nocardia asteroides]VEG35116.1 3-ketoacyl-CoA thiolase [Nocardia asteroides]GAD82158.1 putative thiolase [Nocardia asteroides NBRC 15531]
MKITLAQQRPVYVAGVGWHRYQKPGDTPYVRLGLTAVREALGDAGIGWAAVDSAYTATALLGMAASRPLFKHLGVTGIPMMQVENASASGSTAFRLACHDVAAGTSDISLVLGVDKLPGAGGAPASTGVPTPAAAYVPPMAHFALLASEYLDRYGATPDQLAAVAVKNYANAAWNPNAQRPRARTIEEVLAGPPLAGPLTRLQCCPLGEGAAAAIVVSDDAIDSLGLDRSRCVRVLSSVLRSEELYGARSFDAELTRATAWAAYRQAGIGPDDLDVVELHDAFTIEELQYVEAMGLAEEGKAAAALERGEFDLGGRVAISTSGGLLGSGHPIGPTGVGQIGEITTQLRGEAGPRQHRGARTGLAHMVGLGAVCAVHILRAGE